MPVYYSSDAMKAGMPLGGIGAGKLEILPNGLLNAFTFQNNWSSPIQGMNGYPGVLGYHLALFIDKKAYLLQTIPVQDIPVLKKIRYEALFPKLKLTYEIPDKSVEVSLEGFSGWLPGNIQDSSLPHVNFSLNIRNLSQKTRQISVMLVVRNTVGEWGIGQVNRVREEGPYLSLELSREDKSRQDVRNGSLVFLFEKKNWKMSFKENWNAVSRNFHFAHENINLSFWKEFYRSGALSSGEAASASVTENRELCSAIAASRPLAAKKNAGLKFSASWYFPNHAFGHYYEAHFKNARAVARYGVSKRAVHEKKVGEIHKLVAKLPFPGWFNEALLQNLAPFYASTWYTRDGRFAFYEAPVVCPLMGTLDVGFYGSIPLAYFFPKLEISQILQFARYQRPDGYIPHDLGRSRLDLPSNGTTFYFWKDLNSKYILMAYRDFIWSRDEGYLRKIYPSVKKALCWLVNVDSDGDGLPDHEGQDQTFDLWPMKGAHPYTSSLYLAALLAARKMAGYFKDKTFFEKCGLLFQGARYSFEKKFWNGRFFGETCALAQLNGQWYADLLDLGSIVSEQNIQKALKNMFKLNSAPSRFGMVNSVLADGRLDKTNDHSRNVWAGMNYAFISLALMRGLPLKDLLNPAKKIWDNVATIQKSPWNQPDTVDSSNGNFVFGDYYYRNMAIWAIPIAYAKSNARTRGILAKLKAI